MGNEVNSIVVIEFLFLECILKVITTDNDIQKYTNPLTTKLHSILPAELIFGNLLIVQISNVEMDL